MGADFLLLILKINYFCETSEVVRVKNWDHLSDPSESFNYQNNPPSENNNYENGLFQKTKIIKMGPFTKIKVLKWAPSQN